MSAHVPVFGELTGLASPASVRVVLLLVRAQPLLLAELEAVEELARLWSARRPPALPGLRLQALDGLGPARVHLAVDLPARDPEPRALGPLAELVAELRTAVPGAGLQAWDPLALLGEVDGRLCTDGRALLPACDAGWVEGPAPAALAPGPGTTLGAARAAAPAPGPDRPDPDTLPDLLRRLDAGALAPPAALAAPARAHGEAAWGLLCAGTLPGACAALIAADLARPGLDAQALAEAARALHSDGDARERAAARDLLAALGQPPPAADADGEELATWDQVAPLGRRLLAWPGLRPDRTEGGARAGEDELDLDQMTPEEPPLAPPLLEAVAGLAQEPALVRLAALAEAPGFARRALGRLGADDDSTAGACLALVTGTWPLARLPGWAGILAGLARDPSRPAATRGLALGVLGAGGGPEAFALLAEAAGWPETELGQAALLGLGAHPDRRVRPLLRAALSAEDRAGAALLALAALRDGGAFHGALALLAAPEAGLRHAAAQALPALGGRRALVPLRVARVEDPSPLVRRAALAGQVALAPLDEAGPLLDAGPPEDREVALRAAGRGGRVDLVPALLRATEAPVPALRRAAAQALGTLGFTPATPRLMELLLDEDVPVAMAALEALVGAGDARCVRLVRLLAGHPGLPGQLAHRVLVRGRQLRRAPPDDRLLLRARAERSMDSQTRARLAAVAKHLPVELRVHERGLDLEGTLDPSRVEVLVDLARALDRIDGLQPGLRWSARDPLHLLGRDAGGWRLALPAGRPLDELPREAGPFAELLPQVPRPPLVAEILPRPAPAPADEALPVGAGARPGAAAPVDEDLVDLDEDVMDERTEQTISAFLEEVTGSPPPPAGSAAPRLHGGAPDLEELLFEPDPGDETHAR